MAGTPIGSSFTSVILIIRADSTPGNGTRVLSMTVIFMWYDELTYYVQIRRVEDGDRPALGDVARRSFQTSYALSPRAIDGAIWPWISEKAFTEKLNSDDVVIFLAVDDSEKIVGFTDSTVRGIDGDIRWLHVAPLHRGCGVGSRLFERTREELLRRGAEQLRGRVLACNVEGNTFYERKGLKAAGKEWTEIGDHHHVETIYVEDDARLERVIASEDREVYVACDETKDSSRSAFRVAYTDPTCDHTYGYYCVSCDMFANAMDTLGRIECPSCGTTSKPTQWDAAYL